MRGKLRRAWLGDSPPERVSAGAQRTTFWKRRSYGDSARSMAGRAWGLGRRIGGGSTKGFRGVTGLC